jgi:glycosyltransferase involved in cell wall biosynthesis
MNVRTKAHAWTPGSAPFFSKCARAVECVADQNNLPGGEMGLFLNHENLARVSVVIPYYNQPEFLSEAVSSAKKQAYSDLEIIVVDDGSRVPAAAVLKDLCGIRIFRTENRGVSAARNLGVQNSSGDYLIFLDSDDRLLPGAVEAHLETMWQRPDVGLTFGSQKVIDRNGAEIHPAHICRPRRDYFEMLLEGNPIGSPGAAMMRRTAVESAGLFNESVSMGEDYDLYLRIARCFPLAQHSFCVLEYRQHNANTSLAQEQMYVSTMSVLDRIESRLTASERKKLAYARRRWKHSFFRRQALSYRLGELYYRFRAMRGVPPVAYFGRKH